MPKGIPLVAAAKTRGSGGGRGCDSNCRKRERPDFPDFPIAVSKVVALLENWIKDIVTLPPVDIMPTAEEKAHPRYYRCHRFCYHPTNNCCRLKILFWTKKEAGEVILGNDVQNVNKQPCPDHARGKQHTGVSVIFEDGSSLCPPEVYEHAKAQRRKMRKKKI